MFKVIQKFVKASFSVQLGWRMWTGLLVIINLIIPWMFFAHQAAKLTLAVFFLSFVFGLVLFQAKGFTRLSGLAHFPWFVLVFYLIAQIDQTSVNNFFGIWMRAVIFLNSASLVVDVFNVFRYISGERESIIGL